MEQRTTLSQSIDIVIQKYADYDVREIVEKFIIGEPQIAEVSVLPDETNAPKITGTGVEDSTVTEGSITYDIQFRAIVPGLDEIVQMIINVEAQNDFYPGYPIVKRGIYYAARMISSQYGTVFTKSHYEKIQKVYSVWICMNPPKERNNTITEYSLTEKHHIGNVEETKEYYDLMNVTMVCLGASDEKTENEFQIPMTEKMEAEVEHMCNLSDGVEQKGIQKGIEIGIEQGIERANRLVIINMLKENEPIEKICRYAQCDEAYVLQIQEENK